MAYLINNFIIMGPIKTYSTSLGKALIEKGAQKLLKPGFPHVKCKELGEFANGKTIVAPIRNPIDWYKSFWHHLERSRSAGHANPHKDAMLKFSNGTLKFEDGLIGMTNFSSLKQVPEQCGSIWGGSKAPYKKHSLSLWSYFIREFYKDDDGNLIPDFLISTDEIFTHLSSIIGVNLNEHKENIHIKNKLSNNDSFDRELITKDLAEWTKLLD